MGHPAELSPPEQERLGWGTRRARLAGKKFRDFTYVWERQWLAAFFGVCVDSTGVTRLGGCGCVDSAGVAATALRVRLVPGAAAGSVADDSVVGSGADSDPAGGTKPAGRPGQLRSRPETTPAAGSEEKYSQRMRWY
jgi:hypothetical protein